MYRKHFIRNLIFLLVVASLALAGCTSAQASEAAKRLLINTHSNYTVQYPEGYDVAIYSPDGVAILVGSLLNASDPRLDIQVSPAEGRTAEQEADRLASEMQSFEIERSALTIDGEPAVVLDQVPGQEITRIVLVAHAGRLYTLRFIPADTNLGEVFEKMEQLYQTVTGSLDFDPMP